jgi:2-polyprenyl-3-methyl-5-hydroxy-6-metoxy-1,4-benzoquinol methylase
MTPACLNDTTLFPYFAIVSYLTKEIKKEKVGMDYKDRLYKNYLTTHIVQRKGIPTTEEYKSRSVTYQEQFGKFLPQDKKARIIDLGCGAGSIVWWLQQTGFVNTSGIDISAEQTKVAQSFGIKNITSGDLKEFLKAVKIPLYDVIFLRDVLEHFKKEDVLELLDLSYLALKDSGTIILQVPNAESPFGARMRYGDFTHEIAFTSGSLSQILRTVGFNNNSFYAWETPPSLRFKSILRFILWRMTETFYKLLLMSEGYKNTIVTQNIIAVAKK